MTFKYKSPKDLLKRAKKTNEPYRCELGDLITLLLDKGSLEKQNHPAGMGLDGDGLHHVVDYKGHKFYTFTSMQLPDGVLNRDWNPTQ